MNNQMKFKKLKAMLDEIDVYYRAIGKMSFDQQCVCPKKGMDQANKDMAFLSQYPFKISHSKKYIKLVNELYLDHDGLNEYEVKCVDNLYKSYQKSKNITPELNMEFDMAAGDSYVAWLNAKENKNYEEFKPHLTKIIELTKKMYSLRDVQKETMYDTILDDFEEGMSIAKWDKFFEAVSNGIVPLIKKLPESKVNIREDFMHRFVSIPDQEKFSKWILEHEGHDMDALCLMTTEHPFTTGFGKGDERVTTHYFENDFVSNIFSTLHEGGHALFDQNEPEDFYKYHISGHMSMGMHECMSRLFENMIARSEAYVSLIYPKIIESFGDTFKDVSEEELYLAINIARPSLIRTEADELTYPLHILIRYELEKGFINGEYGTEGLDKRWADTYEKYLGIRPSNASEGILQDVHWSGTYGYFPSYALGSAYAAQIYHAMNKDIDIDREIRNDNIKAIVEWLKNHAWNIASIKNPDVWIKEVTGEEFNPQYYVDYLVKKFSKIYKLD